VRVNDAHHGRIGHRGKMPASTFQLLFGPDSHSFVSHCLNILDIIMFVNTKEGVQKLSFSEGRPAIVVARPDTLSTSPEGLSRSCWILASLELLVLLRRAVTRFPSPVSSLLPTSSGSTLVDIH
jgi:hypothetical protein